MSNIYIQEPPTEGKICLETTAGDIDIELWSREAPKACRNFVQLCMEGYYDGTIFHRLVKGFIVQGGDPTGTGSGGNSIWGKPFKDEFHSRLRFVRRGLVAMANAGKDDNGSQFFFTLGATPELQNKHTIFGKVGGNTIYNMLKLEEGLTDEDEKPLFPHKILKTKILSNPFNDIVPRETIKKIKDDKKESKKSKSTAAATKNYKLLSFGEEAEEDEGEVEEVNKKYSGKSKSSHDLIKDPKLSSEPALDTSSMSKKKKKKRRHSDSESDSEEDEKDEKSESDREEDSKERKHKTEKDIQSVRDKLKKKEDKSKPASSSKSKSGDKEKSKREVDDDDDEEYYLGKQEKMEQQKKLENLRKEYQELKRSMKKEKDAKEEEAQKAAKEEKEKVAKLAQDNSIIQAYLEEQKKYKNVKAKAPKKGEDREAMTLALLAKFKNKIETAKESFSDKDLPPVKETENAEEEEDDGEDNPDDISWLARKLHYEKNKEEVLAKDANRKGDDWFDIYDPRNSLTKRRREKALEDSKEKKRARINN